jgi:hypothetical protein
MRGVVWFLAVLVCCLVPAVISSLVALALTGSQVLSWGTGVALFFYGLDFCFVRRR